MISSGMMVTALLSIPWGIWQALAVCLVSMVLLAPPGHLVGRKPMVAPPARAASTVVRAAPNHRVRLHHSETVQGPEGVRTNDRTI
ncbi:hypothetical protein DMH15_13445 [Streptomyces sp. WAC 06725]|uniref:hypothetical protein n=1 Tax=Streptomyces sp. WAC 06725 TaxID=2203209 RepID=UPI000F73CC96|nr:hypothetical protein [Streptomyces sp. WAC 06725]RSO41282.1 hypothetical protein DMH15_13445 [Streptomyces sp. WAC 06725]